MILSLPDLLTLIRQTLSNPRGVAAAILDLRLDRPVLWPALALVVTLGVLLGALAPPGAALPFGPFVTWLMTGAAVVTLVFALFYTGQALGGRGTFPGTLALVVWLELVELAIRAVLIALLWLTGPAMEPALTFLFGAVMVVLLIHFTDVLHGFHSLWRAFGTLVVAGLAMAFGLVLIVTLIGGLAGV
jgi:hypothetical protein